ncbi:MAG: radical SAM family heme chaperone HemW [Ruminococcus sp.]|nr:radical SAM family heme chaperone HemW [Ruminococcus sp.]
MTGIYIHVPFCLRKCLYCSFYSLRYDEERARRYTETICRNISSYKGRAIGADTVYFGGGTPSLLSAGQVSKILDCCADTFVLSSPEVTLEANPGTADVQKLRDLRSAGVGRLSFGIQSASDERLKMLGRAHRFDEGQNAVIQAYSAGFEHISCDVMLGLCAGGGELEETIKKITELPIDHVSAYMLKREEGTPFAGKQYDELVADEELLCEEYLSCVRLLAERGFEQYEISNFALNSHARSKHNLKYWHGEEYLGFGPAAHSFFDGVRYCCPEDLDSFINSPLQQQTVLERDPDRGEEYLMLGLRLTEGIRLEKVGELFSGRGEERVRRLARELCRAGYAEMSGDRLSLLPEGFLISNTIICELIDAASG